METSENVNIGFDDVYQLITSLEGKRIVFPRDGIGEVEQHHAGAKCVYTSISAQVFALKLLLEILQPRIEDDTVYLLSVV